MSIRLAATFSLVLGISACAPIMDSHGYVPSRSDLDLVAVGADTKGSVEEILGLPSDTGVLEDGSWYYVGSTVRNFLFYAPEVVDRKVIVLDFDQNDVLTGMTEFGMEQGRIIDLQTRVTPTDSRRTNVLSALFGNVGTIAPPLPGG